MFQSILLLLFLAHVITLVNCQNPLTSCNNPAQPCNPEQDYFPEKIVIDHAQNIPELTYSNTYVDFTVSSSGTEFKYRLVQCGCPPSNPESSRQILFTSPTDLHIGEGPVLALITRVIPDLEALAFVNVVQFIFTPEVRDRVNDGRTKELESNSDFKVKYEDLRGSIVDLSIIGSFEVTDYTAASTGKPFLVVSEVEEQTPLGRAEWMKIIGMVLSKAQLANTAFNNTMNAYIDIRRRAADIRRSPSVFFNRGRRSFSGPGFEWTFPGGKQYITQIIRDANADYRFENDGKEMGTQLTFEQVVDQFGSARFLLNSDRFFPSRDDATLTEYVNGDGTGTDKEFEMEFSRTAKQLDAVRCENVWVNTRRITEDGQATDFFERAIFSPDLVLRDFAIALHPTINLTGDPFFSYSYGKAPESVRGGPCPYVELDDEPESGTTFVDKQFFINGMNRFQVEDELRENVLPNLWEALEIDREQIEVFFPRTSFGNTRNATAVVRTVVPADRAITFKDSDIVLTTLRTSLNGSSGISETSSSIIGEPTESEVVPESDDTTDPPAESDDTADPPAGSDDTVDPPAESGDTGNPSSESGAGEDSKDLSSGAIVGIVIASLIVIIAACVLIIAWNRKRVAYGAGVGNDAFWTQDEAEPVF